MIIDVSLLMLF